MILDNGAYTSYGRGVSLTESMLGGALYRLPAYRYNGYVVYTNNPFGGAFRRFWESTMVRVFVRRALRQALAMPPAG